jgi:hypothetical protein
MKKLLVSALLLLPAVTFAGSAFNGTWTARLDSLKVAGKPDVFVLANGKYSCTSCDPPLAKVPTDGAWHKVTGHDYYDEIMVKVLGPQSIEITQRLAGKIAGVNTIEVSADGNTLNGKFTGYQGAEPVTGTYTEKRVAAGLAGAHAISGSWLQDQMSSGNEALRTVSYEMTADGFSMNANGQSYAAKFDGKQYPVAGDPGHTMVTVKKLDDRTVMETDFRKGKIVDETRISVAPDGKTLEVTDKDLAHGQTVSVTMDKKQ